MWWSLNVEAFAAWGWIPPVLHCSLKHSPKPQEHNFSPGKCLHLTKHKSLRGCYNSLENQSYIWNQFFDFSNPLVKFSKNQRNSFYPTLPFWLCLWKRERIAQQWWIPFLTHHGDVPFKSPITTVNECQRVLITWVWLVALNAMIVCNEKENADMDLSKDDCLFRIPGSIFIWHILLH